MNVKISDLWKPMFAAAKESLGSDWKHARGLARPEFKRLARVFVDIGKMAASGEITRSEAKSLIRIHRNATLMVLLTVQGLGILAVENAVNSAVGAVRDTVNTAAGINLL